MHNPLFSFVLIVLGGIIIIVILNFCHDIMRARRKKKKVKEIDRDLRDEKTWGQNFKDSYFNK